MDVAIDTLRNIVSEVFHPDCACREHGFTSTFDPHRDAEEKTKSYTERDVEKILTSVEHLIRTLNNNYDSRFNVFFERIFQQTQSLHELSVTDGGSLKSNLNRIFTIVTLIVDVVVTNPNEGNLQALVRFYTWNVRKIREICACRGDGDDTAETELVSRLRLLCVVYEEMGKVHGCARNEDCRRCRSLVAFTKLVANIEEDVEMFSQLVISTYQVASTQTLLDVIPKYVGIKGRNGVVKSTWNVLLRSVSFSSEDDDNSRTFTAMCYLSDLFFTLDNKHELGKMFTDSNYWLMLQRGLTHSDYGIRKQAVFLVRRSICYIQENSLEFCSSKKVNDNCCGANNVLICWDSKLGKDQMNDYLVVCLIIEYLEEKQMHIVSSIFDVVEKFMERNGRGSGGLDVSWVIIVIQRMLSHDNVKIVKEGILQLLKIPISMYESQGMMKKALRLLVSHLNCTQLYMAEWLQLTTALTNYFALCSKSETGNAFFKIIIEEVCRVRWSSEALFFLVHSWDSVARKDYWEKKELSLIRELVQFGTCNHYTYIKSGMQCQLLTAGMKLINTRAVTLEDVAVYLDAFHRRTSLRRGTRMWEKIVTWMAESYTPSQVQDYLLEEKSRSLGKMVVFLSDAGLCDVEYLQRYLNDVLGGPFSPDAHLRAYRDLNVEERRLSVICDVAEESAGDFVKFFKARLPYMLRYIEERLTGSDANQVRHLAMLETLLKRGGECLPRVLLRQWAERIIARLRTCPECPDECIQVKALNLLGEATEGIDWSELRPYLDRGLNRVPAKSALKGDCVRNRWEAFCRVADVSVPNLASLCIDALDVGGRDVLVPVAAVLEKALRSMSGEEFEKLAHALWTVIAERKKNEEYHRWTEIFVGTVFQAELMERTEMREVLLKYSRRFLSETDGAVNAGNILMKQLEKLCQKPGIQDGEIAFYMDTLPRALLYGRVRRKEERLVDVACSAVQAAGLSPLKNDAATSNEIRARGLGITLKVAERAGPGLASPLIDSLIGLAEERCGSRSRRYFSDSNVHRVKQRLLQSLLVLECYASQDKRRELWEWSKRRLVTENNQRSVRYLLEWLMLRIISGDSFAREDIWKCFDEGSDTRTGSMCSLLSIVYHAAKLLLPGEVGAWVRRSVETCLPYCMAQHYSVRLYAQVTLRKLLEFSKEVRKEYQFVLTALSQSIERGRAVKNCAKLEEDFYFAAFHALDHFSLESILCHIPQLTSVSSDEWVTKEMLESVRVGGSRLVPVVSASDSLSCFRSSVSLSDARAGEERSLVEDNDGDSDQSQQNLQKKMIPTKCLLTEELELESLSLGWGSWRGSRGTGELIVVASLIDRLPNLGGLSRTCEVFGVSELVLSSLKYAEDKQFQSLSVTAEKWITLTEVKPFHLSEYLTRMKRDGYAILCAEQTVNSVPLQDVEFPKRSVLVLGNEKEGIPPPLLLLMDTCVEIPQIGVIRSLNVHVTGALFVWEYAKQHNFPRLRSK